MENGTWEYQELPKGRKIVKNKWVYKLKLAVDENMDHYKTRLMAKGFTQKEGVDFKETFNPIVKFDSIKTMFSITTIEDINITQFDVCTFFLYGEIEDKIYMTHPLGFVNIKERGKFVECVMRCMGFDSFPKFGIRSSVCFSLNIVLLSPLLMDVCTIVH
jgi:hypothetical protein